MWHTVCHPVLAPRWFMEASLRAGDRRRLTGLPQGPAGRVSEGRIEAWPRQSPWHFTAAVHGGQDGGQGTGEAARKTPARDRRHFSTKIHAWRHRRSIRILLRSVDAPGLAFLERPSASAPLGRGVRRPAVTSLSPAGLDATTAKIRPSSHWPHDRSTIIVLCRERLRSRPPTFLRPVSDGRALELDRQTIMLMRKLKRQQIEREKRLGMREAGRFNAQLMDFIRPHVQPGVSTGEIDRLVHQYTLDHGHIPASLNYQGFPKSCCTSVNEVICHGIPGDYVLRDGDLVNVDLTTIVNGWHGDQSETFLIGNVSDEARALTQCAFDCLWAAIDVVKPNCRISDIGAAVIRVAHARGFSVVRDYVGHGLGRRFHQDPTISHVPTPEGRRQRLLPGVAFTIEPMINAGGPEGQQDLADGWTVRTRDGKLSAQFEHTILMEHDGPAILTLTQNGPQRGHQF